MERHRLGITSGLSAYVLWGLLTIYWKELTGLDAFGLIGQRIVWSVVLLVAVLAATRRLGELRPVLAQRALVVRTAAASMLLAVNWTCFVWAVTHGNVVETALGYVMAPLGIVVLGVVVLREHLRVAQRVALALAVVAVAVLTAGYGRVPWLALVLAVTWSAYGLLKKTVSLDPLMSLTAETVVLAPLALGVIVLTSALGHDVVTQASTTQLVLVPLAGVVTAVPLLLFAAAAHRVPLTTLGPLQYAVPIINFVLGVAIYDEAMPGWRLVGFALVWVALVVSTVDALRATRVRGAAPELEAELEAVPLDG